MSRCHREAPQPFDGTCERLGDPSLHASLTRVRDGLERRAEETTGHHLRVVRPIPAAGRRPDPSALSQLEELFVDAGLLVLGPVGLLQSLQILGELELAVADERLHSQLPRVAQQRGGRHDHRQQQDEDAERDEVVPPSHGRTTRAAPRLHDGDHEQDGAEAGSEGRPAHHCSQAGACQEEPDDSRARYDHERGRQLHPWVEQEPRAERRTSR